MADRLLLFTVFLGLLLLRLPWSWGGGWEFGKLECHKACCFCRDSAFFFPFEKCSSDVASLWSSGSVDFDFFFFFFATVLVAFMEERIFGGPYSIIPDDVTLIVF